jgi:hypothetical protein
LVTAAAVIIGGIWAYFKFVKGRTFRPRLDVDTQGEWHVINGQRWLHSRVRLKNIGGSDVKLRQDGTGLRLSRLLPRDPTRKRAKWESLTVCKIFEDHDWIEPGETISDDSLLNLDVPEGEPVMFQARLVCQQRKEEKNITVKSRRIVPAGSKLEVAREN